MAIPTGPRRALGKNVSCRSYNLTMFRMRAHTRGSRSQVSNNAHRILYGRAIIGSRR
ncbi:hypothetical protein DIPPA_09204 [Diplonema papillatum]|nr:hypothetical protein DIPPA_03736 [Diplonema papillatum]KAJ9450480.1 hypothetical protein DIPPA_09204 [Diplonema papillatum]